MATGSTLPPEPGAVTPDARDLHRVITASVRELLETVRLEAHAGPVDEAQLERIFRDAAPIVHSSPTRSGASCSRISSA